jgi:hypothetical protein
MNKLTMSYDDLGAVICFCVFALLMGAWELWWLVKWIRLHDE